MKTIVSLIIIPLFLLIYSCKKDTKNNNSFPNCGNVTDVDGNAYNTVTIGTQCWMQQNLKTTRFNDGSTITLVTDDIEWAKDTTPGYCWYNDSIQYKIPYGALYNWYAVNTGKLCPKGWHMPDTAEWRILVNYLGGDSIAGGKMKETGTTYWKSPNTGATNSSGFYALGAGHRGYSSGLFSHMGIFSVWWSYNDYNMTLSWFCELSWGNSDAFVSSLLKEEGISVRCLKD